MPVDFTADIAQALTAPQVQTAIAGMVRLAVRAELREALAPEPLLGVPAAAARLGLSEAALRKAVERGTVKCVRIGRRLRFRQSDLFQPPATHAAQSDTGTVVMAKPAAVTGLASKARGRS